MKFEKVEKWTDVVMLVWSIVQSVTCAITGRCSEALAWSSVAMWICIAMMRKSTRDELYGLLLKALGKPKGSEAAR